MVKPPLLPFSTLFEKRICEDGDLSHKGDEGLFWCLSYRDALLILCLEICLGAVGDQG